MLKKIQKTVCKVLEEELLTVLAVCIVALGVLFVRAGTSISTDISFVVYPAEGMLELIQPNGGESWTVGTVHNITWNSWGPVNNVKIELQRSVGGSWTTIVESTEDDGSHPWTVTSPDTSAAKIKISKVGDPTVYDESANVFSIVAEGGGGAAIGVPGPLVPGIYNVSPRAFTNNSVVELTANGFNLDYGSKAFLGNTEITVKYAVGYKMIAVVPVSFPLGSYTFRVRHPSGQEGSYGSRITVYADEYEAFVVEQSAADLAMAPGALTEVWVKLQNSSNYTWKKDGTNQFRLGVVGDGSSIFYDPRSWVVSNRAARLFESVEIKYGEIGMFRFLIKAPSQAGEYDGFFAPVIEGVKWLSAPQIKWHVRVGAEVIPPTTGGEQYYSAEWVGQSPYLTLNRGEEATLWVEFKNTGTIPWLNYGSNPVRLGTSRPQDRLSAFRNGEWVLPNRPAVVNGVGTSTADGYSIAPGEIGRFTFVIKVPSRAGRYKEYFKPVAEFITWMEDGGVYWDLTVRGVSRTLTVSGQPKAPSTGGQPQSLVPTFEVQEPRVFADSVERAFSGLVGYFERLFSDLKGLFGSLP
ncbi:hypothetical protein A2V68_00925 [candidate division Kazan bacterium RBG_13_50_9]|uniref:Next to BRCA1 central domain-containing protein n=1 Tax=candidate division Kazan bacterium RBG_13_50_9 TaxID=1798535 RepID=A0A1F4NSP8_UNCK3|nr:MAG: hypothetical protein A2V68_00925 [candidate division Kazan bacterium RBG_13_50_9]